MGHGGLCCLNQRAADSQLEGVDGICQLLRGDEKWVGKARREEDKETKLMMLRRNETGDNDTGDGAVATRTQKTRQKVTSLFMQ